MFRYGKAGLKLPGVKVTTFINFICNDMVELHVSELHWPYAQGNALTTEGIFRISGKIATIRVDRSADIVISQFFKEVERMESSGVVAGEGSR